MKTQTYRKKWLRARGAYERRMFITFMRSIKKTVKAINWETIDETNFRAILEIGIKEDLILEAFVESYLKVGVIHGKKVLREIKIETKTFSNEDFVTNYRGSLYSFLRENLGLKITSVRSTLIQSLISEIEKGMKEGKDIRQISKDIQKLVNSKRFYRWQALRIVRTETTAAANYGAIQAGSTTGLPLDKVWISATDNRVRRKPKSVYDHAELNGKKIPKDELFDDAGSKLRFPGDPRGHAGSVINCRCTIALLPRRDENGDLILNYDF